MRNDPIANLNKQIIEAVTQVRGRAEASGGAVVVETDAYGTITDLRISSAAMAVEGDRLARAIVQCHQTARRQAEVEANRVYAELAGLSDASVPASRPGVREMEEPEWEEPTPTRITHAV
ncbi:YbaB/EbfC family nucleoid-associated protein [Nocardia sp. NPDC088792]|uniref:YbaB/EbfC family nucleoid-associated protein n=1 Tax=Nocardia sp. NPDC088792 TaxID=3364332 RepID=UPI0037FCF8A0